MKTYQYTSPKNIVVHVIDEDGISRMSMLASSVPDGAEILPYVEPPAPIPAAVTMRQARLALLGAGLLDDVEAVIASAGREAQIEWEYASVVERSNHVIAVVQQQQDMTDAQIDDLFREAAKL